MTITLTKRRLLIGLSAFLIGAAAGLWLARQVLTAVALNGLLGLSGATDVSFTVTTATPWRVQIEDIHFKIRGQPFAAQRVTLSRVHWWTPSLGSLRVEGANVPVDLETPQRKPVAVASKPAAAVRSGKLPLQEFSLGGKLLLSAGELAWPTVAVTVEAKVETGDIVVAKIRTAATGLTATADVRFDVAGAAADFHVASVEVDVKTWQGFVQRAADLPASDWVAQGRLTGTADGRWADGKLQATARAQLRDAQVENTPKGITATGVEADIDITDVAKFATKPATLRVRAVQAGQLQLRDLEFQFHFESPDEVAVAKATLATLGGTVAAEPFRYRFSRGEIDAVVLIEGVRVEEVMALTPALPAQATGRVNGRFPLHLGPDGFLFGTGWLQLKPGAYAEIQFNAAGLLTGGAAPNSPSYAVLKKVESGLLKLKVNELRLDIRPPNVPAGRSAQLHIAGEPVDPQVKAPVVLDLNVNGPLEKLINFGLDSRLSFGSKP
jgi:hypothetical protein